MEYLPPTPGELPNSTKARRRKLKRMCSPTHEAGQKKKHQMRVKKKRSEMTEEQHKALNEKKRKAMQIARKRQANVRSLQQVVDQKQKRRKLYLEQRTKKWKRETTNRDVSKYPKQPFDPRIPQTISLH